MKKTLSTLLNITLIGFFLLPSTITVQANQNEGGAWVLVEVIDKDCAEEIAKVNKDYEDVYHHEGSYSRNNFTITQTYIGPTEDYYDPPQIHGESISMTASFSVPPQVINAGEEITINISLSALDNHSFYNPFGSVKARIGKNDQAYSRFTNAKGEDSFRSDIHNNFASFNETVTAIAPGGSEGDTLEIGFTLNFGHDMETWYVYGWKEADGAMPEPKPTQTGCPADTDEKKLEHILKLYTARIPNGKTSSALINNTYALLGNSEYKEFACGGYQDKVLKLLDGLKFSKDPCERQLLDDWDYGPIQALSGGHQAVVIYPKGSDWKHTGIVLDPWLEQTPKTYKIFDWEKKFKLGIGPSDVYRETKAYPIFDGGDYLDLRKGDLKFTKEEMKFIHSLTPEKRAAFTNMDKLRQKLWLEARMQGAEKTQKVIAHCPLNLYILDSNGNRSGISGTEILTELPDVHFLILKLTDGTNYTEITYPEKSDYTLVLEGTDEGQAHVFQGHILLLEEPTPPVQQYSFAVNKGETYKIATDRLGAPMQWEGGSLEPKAITEISATFLEDLPGLDVHDTLETDDIQNEFYDNNGIIENSSKNSTTIWIFILCGLASLGFLLVTGLVIVYIILKKKQKAAQ
jgi:hypothetical protein